MSKTRLFSPRWVTGWLVAAGVVLAVQLESAAEKCYQPKENAMVLCANPSPPSTVTKCDGLPGPPTGICGSSRWYKINQFPDGAEEAANGATKQVMADCYQYTTCKWDFFGSKCVNDTTYPTYPPNGWFPAPKTVVDPDKKCPSS